MTDTAALTESMTKALTDAGYENVSIHWAPWEVGDSELIGAIKATKGEVWVRQMVTETAARLLKPGLFQALLVRSLERGVAAILKEPKE